MIILYLSANILHIFKTCQNFKVYYFFFFGKFHCNYFTKLLSKRFHIFINCYINSLKETFTFFLKKIFENFKYHKLYFQRFYHSLNYMNKLELLKVQILLTSNILIVINSLIIVTNIHYFLNTRYRLIDPSRRNCER